LDVWMPDMDGITTLQKLKDLRNDIPVVIMSGHATIETAVKATKLGALDFLEKPLSLDKLLPMLEHAHALCEQRSQRTALFSSAVPLIGESAGIEQVRQQIRVFAPKNSWVLIVGENGTGKEIVAQNIHVQSTRASKTFVTINCAALPDEVVERELFGVVSESGVGAAEGRKGKLELANEGTLYIDEIADTSLKIQARILRLLDDQSFERVGSVEKVPVDVRIIATSTKDLRHEVSGGRFREDLYYRLNAVPFELPPLRERGQDVLLLADYFLEKSALEMGGPRKHFTETAEGALLAYLWPGNVRELRNLIERLSVTLAGDTIDLDDLPPNIARVQRSSDASAAFAVGTSLKQAKTDFERLFILDKLQENQWNVSKTADAIGIERSNLHRKLKSYEIDPKRLKG